MRRLSHRRWRSHLFLTRQCEHHAGDAGGELSHGLGGQRWAAQDELAAGGWIGDPGSQARWEAYAAISTFMLWNKPLFAAKGPITVVGDAIGVLFGTTALHSKDIQINRLFMELALILAPTGRAIEAIHVWSEDNALADQLSRLPHESAKPPRELEGIRRTVWPDNLPWQIVK